MNRRKIYLIAIFTALFVMISFIILGVKRNIGWLSGLGVVIFALTLTVIGIIHKVSALREIRAALNEGEDEEDSLTNRFKNSTVGDKIKVIALFGSLGLLLLIMVVGVALANFGKVIEGLSLTGFILMGVGGGGFFLEIILIIVISFVKNRK